MVGTALLILSIAGGNKDNDEDLRSNLINASTLDLDSPNPRSETQLEKRSHMKSHSALNVKFDHEEHCHPVLIQ